MTIEILFPEYCNLFGDYGNILYLKACLPQAEFVETSMNDQPQFVSREIDLLYMGPMSEIAQEKVITRLLPYKEQLRERIASGGCCLFTGNAMEVLFREITDGERKIPGLGLLDFTAERNFSHRYNANFLGEFEGFPLLGCKTQFTMAYGDNSKNYFARATRGTGLNRESTLEGVREKNFFGTYLVGPLLVMNPRFTRYLLELLGTDAASIAFEPAMELAYEQRLREFQDLGVVMEKEGDTNQINLSTALLEPLVRLFSRLRRK